MDTLLTFCAALAAGPVCESLCRLPRPCGWPRARLTGALTLAGALFAVLLWITLRPAFSALGVWAGLLALSLTNNAKLEALREPLLADDRAELLQVVSHPGFYLPFLTRAQALGLASSALAVPAALFLSAPMEPSALPAVLTMGLAGLLARLGLGVTVGLGLWLLALPSLLPRLRALLSHDPATDMARLGFFGLFGISLLTSWDARPRRTLRSEPGPWPTLVRPASGPRPHLLAVENESFMDIARLHPELAHLQPELNRLRKAGASSGPLDVPAFGANTIRTEFAFLSGRAPESLGLERFQPYARLARKPMDSLARRLADLGYHTVCLHPNSGAFYARRKVMPSLGFHEFLDLPRLEAMQALERFGPHTADLALARHVLTLLRQARQPLFLFVISMENHSPWLPGRLSPEQLIATPSHAGGVKLDYASRCYLRHLQNADAMLGTLARGLTETEGGTLCFYGDHQPNLPALGLSGPPAESRSDYLLWRSGSACATQVQPLRAHVLGRELLCLAGLTAEQGQAT